MTVIVAAQLKGGGVCIAADSQTTIGWEKAQAQGSKLWTVAPYAFGSAGDVRAAQVVRHFTTWPKFRPDEDGDTEAFLTRSVVPAIRTATANHGIVRNVSGVESIGCQLVIAWGDTLATIHGNGAATTSRFGRIAIGSGYAEALGYLGDRGPWTVAQVIEAAHRATLTAHGVDGPIDHVTTRNHKLTRGAE